MRRGNYLDFVMLDFQLGLLSLAAALKKDHYKVELTDLAWLIRKKQLTISNSFSLNAAKFIVRQNIDILGFNTRCDSYPVVLNIARRCKQLNPNSTIILGGPQATLTDVETLRTFPFVDIIVRGEGEATILELINKLSNKWDLKDTAGITYRKDGQIIRNKERELIRDLDSIPLPAYHLMDKYLSGYNKLKDALVYICVGRGCPYRCAFCATGVMWRRLFRLRRPENILEEIELLNKKYGINKFDFGHDHFLLDRRFVKKICNLLLARGININWSCSSRLHAVGPVLLKKMAQAGCRDIYFGIESGSAQIQKVIRKNLNLSLIPKIIKECEKYNIYLRMSFVIGFPQERHKDIDATLRLILKYTVICRNYIYFQLHLFAPMAGTILFEENQDRLVFTGFWSRVSEGPMIRIKENIHLIKKHPMLFSNFYFVKPGYVTANFLYKTAKTFLNLLYTYPLSFYMATKELNLTPSEITTSMDRWARKRNLVSNSSLSVFSLQEVTRYFPVFLKAIYRNNKTSFKFLSHIIQAERNLCQKYLKESNRIVGRLEMFKEAIPEARNPFLKNYHELKMPKTSRLNS
ncbi:B12-binding domain-containing radical SAM protein [Candidatus Omnitrophota bacterium]